MSLTPLQKNVVAAHSNLFANCLPDLGRVADSLDVSLLDRGSGPRLKGGIEVKKLFAALFVCATMLQFSVFALPSYDLIAHEEQPGWMVGQFWKEEATNKIFKVIAVEKTVTETPDEIITTYQPYITCFESGELATVADCND